MSRYPTSPALNHQPDNDKAKRQPALSYGSFILRLNLTDRNFPEISVLAATDDLNPCDFASTADLHTYALGPNPVDHGEGAITRGENCDTTLTPNVLRSTAANRPRLSLSDLCLTVRQLDVLALMMQGKSNKAICRNLGLAEPTVKNHVTAILRKLDVTNRTEAVIAVGERGWQLPSFPSCETKSNRKTFDSPRLAIVGGRK
jgi:DNA-binding NarL/FixJ family response regulator